MYAVQISKNMQAVNILDYGLLLESLGIVERDAECGEAKISIGDFQIDGYNIDNRACMSVYL